MVGLGTIWSYVLDAPAIAGFIATAGSGSADQSPLRHDRLRNGNENLCTGASGYIGGSVRGASHRCRTSGDRPGSLAREGRGGSRAGHPALAGNARRRRNSGAGGAAADVVVNAASADHKGAVESLLGALAGSGKPFIHTSGSSIVGTRAKGERSDAIFDEDTPITPSPARVARVALNEFILPTATRAAVRSSSVRA